MYTIKGLGAAGDIQLFIIGVKAILKKMPKSTVQKLPEQINDTETEKSFIDYD